MDSDGAGGRAVKASQKVEESGLARDRATEQGDEFAGLDLEGDRIDGVNQGFAQLVGARDSVGTDDGGLRGGGHGWNRVSIIVIRAGVESFSEAAGNFWIGDVWTLPPPRSFSQRVRNLLILFGLTGKLLGKNVQRSA